MKDTTKLAIWMTAAALALLIGFLRAADVAPGYSFSDGEQVTAAKFNQATAGSINTSFYYGKSAKAAPVGDDTILIYQSSPAGFYKCTLNQAVYASQWLVSNQTETAIAPADFVLFWDTSGGANAKVSYTAFLTNRALVTNADVSATASGTFRLFGDDGTNLANITLSNALWHRALDIGLTNLPATTAPDSNDFFVVYKNDGPGTNMLLNATNLIAAWAEQSAPNTNDYLLLLNGTNGLQKITVQSLTNITTPAALAGTMYSNAIAMPVAQTWTDLGLSPTIIQYSCLCTSDDATYKAGEIVDIESFMDTDNGNKAFSLTVSNTWVRSKLSANPYVAGTNGVKAAVTPAKWNLVIKAIKLNGL